MGTSLKYLIYNILFILLLSSCVNQVKNIQSNQKYKLMNIDSLSYKYNNILHFERDSRIYLVVTKKEKIKNCKKTKKGKMYNLNIKSAFPSNYPNFRDINSQYMYNEEVIYFLKAENIEWGLYKTENIKGLCYKNKS